MARSHAETEEAAALITQAGGIAQAFPANVTVPAAVKGARDAIARALGPVDVLVNNARRRQTVWALLGD